LEKTVLKITNFLTLPDNRRLAYAEFGQPDGHPVFHFHGSPSSRLEPLLLGDAVFRKLGLRIIAPDRPGMGQSDFQLDRGFSDWPNDVVFLADALGLDKFSILGISGGCGYVAACAAKVPERLHSAVIVSGAWPMHYIEDMPTASRLLWFLAKKAPIFHKILLKLMLRSLKGSPEKLLATFKKQLPPVDYAVIESPERMQAFAQMSLESMRKGVKGATRDLQLYVQEWDFSLDEIQIPLTLFHGEKDMNVPIAAVKRVMASLPMARLVTYPDEAHISLIVNHLDVIAKALVGPKAPPICIEKSG
jgi:pimeloyl-ACP methyl ester carboxylesterase